MLLLEKKVQDILVERGIFRRSEIDILLQRYASEVMTLIFDNIQLYIEHKKLTEAQKYLESIIDEIKKKKQSSVDDQIKFYTEIYNLLKDYPEIVKWINDELMCISDALNNSIMTNIDDKTKSLILDFMEEDLKQMEVNEKLAEKKLSSPEFDKV